MRLLLLALCLMYLLPSTAQRNRLERILREYRDSFGTWYEQMEQYEVQILYTQIDRDLDNRPSFTTYRYGVDPNRYFYPASTVKMPAAFLALEKLHRLGVVGLGPDTPIRFGAGHAPQTGVVIDTSAADMLPSIGHYVRKIFLVSDNDAYNRLYEFLGQRSFNQRLREKGYGKTRIIHRLSEPGFDTLTNRYTNPFSFYHFDTTFYEQREVYSQFYDDLGLIEQVRGVAYEDANGNIINEPFDFRHKNYMSLQDMHDMLRAVLFPETVAASSRFDLRTEDYELLYRAMSERPRESTSPRYDLPDNYVKFWMYGDRDSTDILDHIRIFNKVGWAYGFLTDVAYIVDLEAGIEFMLVATIHVNANQTYNDGVYEYEEIGLPFFGELGRAVYQYELERRRRNVADLSKWRF